MNKKFEEFLFWLGPIMAGFNVASHVLAFFGIGALSSWLIEKWFPFTRWLWAEIFFSLDFPDIGEVEKDALTTLMFFAPLGFWALLKSEEDEQNAEYKMAGLFSGIFFLIVVSKDFFIKLHSNAYSIVSELPLVVALFLVIAGLFISYLGAMLTRFKWQPPANLKIDWPPADDRRTTRPNDHPDQDDQPKSMSDFRSIDLISPFEAWELLPKPILRGYLFQNSWKILTYFLGTGAFVIFLLAALLFIQSIGVVSSYCFFLIALFCYSSITFSPYRLFATVGIVITFVLSGLMYDVVIAVADFVSSAQVGK
ncbi:hypothetical protein [Pseudophaeobacter leonis]|uniref:hypothetical protein n=1 Tax=Pseudophaeobacter leonis TaxID=1144477 RepID=UPI00111C71FB|nr:hypothetical protein [Pseudophaeobacter leonis]